MFIFSLFTNTYVFFFSLIGHILYVYCQPDQAYIMCLLSAWSGIQWKGNETDNFIFLVVHSTLLSWRLYVIIVSLITHTHVFIVSMIGHTLCVHCQSDHTYTCVHCEPDQAYIMCLLSVLSHINMCPLSVWSGIHAAFLVRRVSFSVASVVNCWTNLSIISIAFAPFG